MFMEYKKGTIMYTKGKIEVTKRPELDYDGIDCGKARLARVYHHYQDAEANAERIKLCWNSHDKLVEEKWDLLKDINKLLTQKAKLVEALELILPFAKGYVAQNNVGSNVTHLLTAVRTLKESEE